MEGRGFKAAKSRNAKDFFDDFQLVNYRDNSHLV